MGACFVKVCFIEGSRDKSDRLGNMCTQLAWHADRFASPSHLPSIRTPGKVSDHLYVQTSPHSRTKLLGFSQPRQPALHNNDDVHRNGPRSIAPRTNKYSPAIFCIAPVLSLIYRSPALRHSFDTPDEHSQEEQVRPPWNP